MKKIEVSEAALDTLQRMVEELQAERDALRNALQVLFDDYKRLADSGDAGSWSLEEQPAGKIALNALAMYKPRANATTMPPSTLR